MKRSLRMLAVPVVFVTAAWLALVEEAPEKASATLQPYQPPVKRPQVEPLAHPVDTTAVLRSMEERMLAPNPPLPRRSYSGEEMDSYFIKMPTGFPCNPGMAGIEYAHDWARDEPEKMFAWLREKDQRFSSEASILFDRWAQADVEAALPGAFQIPDSTLRAQALLTTLEHVAKSSLDRARQLLVDNSGLFTAENAKSISFDYDSPISSWQLVQSLPPGAERTRLEIHYLNDRSDETAAGIWNQASEAQQREWVDAGFSPYLGDRFAGLGELRRIRAETTRNADDVKTFLDAHGAEWARQDLATAATWAMDHCKGIAKEDSVFSLYEAALRENPEHTIEVWRQLPESYLKKNLAKAMVANTPEEKRAEVEAALRRP